MPMGLLDVLGDASALVCLDGRPQRVACDVLASLDPVSLQPIGAVSAWRGAGPISGAWWSSTLRCNLEVGNQRQRDALMLEDFTGSLRRVTPRPMRLTFPGIDLTLNPSHLIERSSGGWDLLIMDPVDPAASLVFTELTGLRLHSPVGLDDSRVVQNVRWLAGYRFSRFEVPTPVRDYLMAALASPRSIRAVCAKALSSTGLPREETLAGIYRMLWSRELITDLHADVLSERTAVKRA